MDSHKMFQEQYQNIKSFIFLKQGHLTYEITIS